MKDMLLFLLALCLFSTAAYGYGQKTARLEALPVVDAVPAVCESNKTDDLQCIKVWFNTNDLGEVRRRVCGSGKGAKSWAK